MAALRRELGLRDLTLFAIASIVGVRWVASAAHAGSGSLLLWVLGALFLMVPLSVAVAALTAKHPDAGGIYIWTRADFGPWHGFLAFWIYWVGIAIWFPGAALFYTGAAAYAAGPRFAYLANERWYLVIASLVVMWIALGSNVIGLQAGKRIASLGAYSVWVLLIVLGIAAWLVLRLRGTATHFAVTPSWNWETLTFWAGIAYALTGMEVIGMMGAEIRDPERNLPRAAWISSVFILLFYIGATAALLVILPAAQISDLNGIAETALSASMLLGRPWLLPLIALLVLFSAVGQFSGLGASVARMPYAAGVDGLLPASFARLHETRATPHISILVFGGISSALLIAVQLGDTVRAAYQTIVSLVVIAGFVPFIYLFASTWKAGKTVSATAGMATTLLALFCAVIPSADITRVWLFELKLAVATATMIGSARLIFSRADLHG